MFGPSEPGGLSAQAGRRLARASQKAALCRPPAPQPAVRAPRSLRAAQRSPQQGVRAAQQSPRPARPPCSPHRARASASPHCIGPMLHAEPQRSAPERALGLAARVATPMFPLQPSFCTSLAFSLPCSSL
eukprot:6182506-Pleurochrysis_carterae.AAC.1